jgi:hypothetical protein
MLLSLLALLLRLSGLLLFGLDFGFPGYPVCNKLHLVIISGIRFSPYNVRFDGERTQWVS